MYVIWDTYINKYPGRVSVYIFFYDLSDYDINQAVGLFRIFFVRFNENINANLSNCQNAQKYI